MANRYLSQGWMDGIRRRVDAGEEPVKSAYGKLMADARAGLEQAPLSITENGGSRYFRQDSVYIPGKDGVRNPASNMKCGELARKLQTTTMDLSLAWRLTGEAKYADKALELVHEWCINQNAYMFPTGKVWDSFTPGIGYGGDIILFLSFHDFFLACYLLNDYAGWNLAARGGVKRWVRAMIEPQRPLMFYHGTDMYNNWEDARLMYLAKGALFLDDVDLLLSVFDRWGAILPKKLTAEGELPRETMRTRSMHYTLFALHSTLEVAEIAKQFGMDLYGLTVNGKNIKAAVDYAAHYLLQMDKWPHQMIEPMGDDRGHLGLFELAHRQWGKTGDERYLPVIAAWGGRPVAGSHATLLFG